MNKREEKALLARRRVTSRVGTMTFGGITYPVRSWSIDPSRTRIDVTSFISPSRWRDLLDGMHEGTLTVEGRFEPPADPFEEKPDGR